MKQYVALTVALAAAWWIWSGHSEPFMLGLGAFSVTTVVWLCRRMRIIDAETIPVWLGIRPFTSYLPWLAREVVVANVQVSRMILDPQLPIHPTMIDMIPTQHTEVGRVILANSITLTPGTVSVDLQDDRIRVHALSPAKAEEDLSGEIDRRVKELEGSGP